jgi:vacuolar-type H+-ATPase subunit H
MASDLADDARKLAGKAADRIDAASQQAKGIAQRAAQTAQETGEAAWDVAQRAGAQARDVAGRAYAQGERTARELAHRVEEQPLTALLIAGAVGYAIAYLVHHRR